MLDSRSAGLHTTSYAMEETSNTVVHSALRRTTVWQRQAMGQTSARDHWQLSERASKQAPPEPTEPTRELQPRERRTSAQTHSHTSAPLKHKRKRKHKHRCEHCNGTSTSTSTSTTAGLHIKRRRTQYTPKRYHYCSVFILSANSVTL